MQKNQGLIFSFGDKFVSDFHRDMEFLPPNTPLLVCDERGKILYKYRLDIRKECFDDVGLLLCDKELDFYLSQRKNKDSLLLEMSEGRNDDFLVLCKTNGGLSRGVVFSSAENGCTRLSDYFEKLCCYKDYLSSFSDIAFSEMSGLPTLRRLDSRVNGTGHFLELCNFDFLENEERFAFPISAAVDKISSFVSAADYGMTVVVEKLLENDNKAVVVPLRFFRIFISCLGVAARYSKTGKIKVLISEQVKGCISIKITTPCSKEQGTDMFEKAARFALEGLGIPVRTLFSDGIYNLEMMLETHRAEEVTLAEEDELTRQIMYIVSDSALADMIFTIIK